MKEEVKRRLEHMGCAAKEGDIEREEESGDNCDKEERERRDEHKRER